MSTPDVDFGAQRPAPGHFWFRLGLALLAIAASPSVYRNWTAWRENDRLRQTSLAFLDDLSSGRKDRALRFLAGDYRQQVERDWKSEFDQAWQATADLSLRVLSVSRQDNAAEVRVSIAKDGFSIEPLLHLRRIGPGDWKITQIDHVAVDPRWQRYQDQEAADAAEKIAEELTQKLGVE